jgi:hypothetical protein
LEEELEIEDEPMLIEEALLVELGEAIWILCAASTKSWIDHKRSGMKTFSRSYYELRLKRMANEPSARLDTH